MKSINYSSIPELARKLKSDLTTEELRTLIRHLISDGTIELSERNIAQGTYAPVVIVCSTCGRPV